MRVVMLSWEFPPKRVGGIAAALEGLAPAVAMQGCSVDVITAGSLILSRVMIASDADSFIASESDILDGIAINLGRGVK